MNTNKNFLKRKARVRARVWGTKSCPRLNVAKSNKSLFAQIINDDEAKTLVGISTLRLPETKGKKPTKVEQASILGEEIAKEAKKLKITKVVFDRSGSLYHGRVKAVAEGARKGGLIF